MKYKAMGFALLLGVVGVTYAAAPVVRQWITQRVTVSAAPSIDSLKAAYTCAGEGPNGKYSGLLEVRRQDSAAQFRLTLADGGQVFGVGFVEHGRLVIAYFAPPGALMTASYEIKGESLVGKWAQMGTGGVFAEVCMAAQHALQAPSIPVEPAKVEPQRKPNGRSQSLSVTYSATGPEGALRVDVQR